MGKQRSTQKMTTQKMATQKNEDLFGNNTNNFLFFFNLSLILVNVYWIKYYTVDILQEDKIPVKISENATMIIFMSLILSCSVVSIYFFIEKKLAFSIILIGIFSLITLVFLEMLKKAVRRASEELFEKITEENQKMKELEFYQKCDQIDFKSFRKLICNLNQNDETDLCPQLNECSSFTNPVFLQKVKSLYNINSDDPKLIVDKYIEKTIANDLNDNKNKRISPQNQTINNDGLNIKRKQLTNQEKIKNIYRSCFP